MAFIRPADARARVVRYEPGETPSADGLQHGDLLVSDSADSVRVVDATDSGSPLRVLSSSAGGGAARRVPLSITQHIESPDTFYTDLVDWSGISVDVSASIHSARVTALAGRPVDPGCVVWWTRGTVRIRSPRSSDIPGGILSVPLSTCTPDAYLQGAAVLPTDPTMSMVRAWMRNVYEAQTYDHVRLLIPGECVFVSLGIPAARFGPISDESTGNSDRLSAPVWASNQNIL